MPRFVFYQPDIAQNLGTMLRLAASMNCEAHVVEPCGFPFSAKALRRSAMDYIDHVTLHTHIDWEAFLQYRTNFAPGRLVLLTTKGRLPYTELTYEDSDYLLVGRESAGVPYDVHENADERIVIPMAKEMRSLNVAVSLAMVTGEAMRQLKRF